MNSQPATYNHHAPLQGARACPHCGAFAHVRPHTTLRAVCNVCGGPRIDLKHPDATLSGREQAALAEAKTAHGSLRKWQVGAGLGGLGTLTVAATTALGSLFSLGAWWLVLGLVFALPMVTLLVTALRRSNNRRKTTDDAIDSAWQSAAQDIAQQATDGITAEQLAEHLGTTTAVAEQMLTTLSIEDKVQSHVTDQGQLMYTTGLRIEGARPAGHGQPQPVGLDAELEALAAEHEAARSQRHNDPFGDG